MTSYLPFCGYGFYYPAGTAANMAALFCSFGLLFTAPLSDVKLTAISMYYKFVRG